jgi:hypothetical protein
MLIPFSDEGFVSSPHTRPEFEAMSAVDRNLV